MLLVGAIEACAVYQGLRAGFGFSAARTPADVAAANLRALSAIAFGALGAGDLLRAVGIVLVAGWLVLWVLRRVAPLALAPVAYTEPVPPASNPVGRP